MMGNTMGISTWENFLENIVTTPWNIVRFIDILLQGKSSMDALRAPLSWLCSKESSGLLVIAMLTNNWLPLAALVPITSGMFPSIFHGVLVATCFWNIQRQTYFPGWWLGHPSERYERQLG